MANKPYASDLSTPVAGGVAYSNKTTSGLIKTGEGSLCGIFVASASSTPTIKVNDDLTGAVTTLVNTFTPSAGTWYPLPFHFNTGLYITISGTVDCTISYS